MTQRLPRSGTRFSLSFSLLLLVALPAWSAPEAPGAKLGTGSPDARESLAVGALLQSRFAFVSVKEPTGRVSEFAFTLPRARLALTGWVGAQVVRYRLEAGVDDGAPALADAYVDVRLVKGALRLRAGHMRKPFSR